MDPIKRWLLWLAENRSLPGGGLGPASVWQQETAGSSWFWQSLCHVSYLPTNVELVSGLGFRCLTL